MISTRVFSIHYVPDAEQDGFAESDEIEPGSQRTQQPEPNDHR